MEVKNHSRSKKLVLKKVVTKHLDSLFPLELARWHCKLSQYHLMKREENSVEKQMLILRTQPKIF